MSFLTPDSDAALDDEALLPVQYADLVSGRSKSPEHLLLLAVLEDAVRCWQLHENASAPHRKALFDEVAEWFASDADDSPFTFLVICQVFGIDPDAVRAGLRRWSERRRADPRSVAALRFRRVRGTRHAIRGEMQKTRAAA